MKTFLGLISAFLIFKTSVVSQSMNSIPEFESPILINRLTKNYKIFNDLVLKYKFIKQVGPFDPSMPLNSHNMYVSYTLHGDTIQWYRAQNKMKLLYINIKNNNMYNNKIAILNCEKKDIIPIKYQKYDKINVLDEAGFESMNIVFYKNKIVKIKYQAHPD